MQVNFSSFSEQQTNEIAEKIAKIAQKGDVFALHGNLGVGKSVFARAFIKKLTQADDVPSPTFTLVQEYDASDFKIFHFDLYRLKNPDEVFEIGFEEAIYGGVSLLEWPEKAKGWMPKDVFDVFITTKGDERIISIEAFSENKISRLSKI